MGGARVSCGGKKMVDDCHVKHGCCMVKVKGGCN